MDTTTLVLANVLLFALYAGVMLLNSRNVGGTRGAMWFAGANLCRGASMLLVGVDWLQLIPSTYGAAASAVLAPSWRKTRTTLTSRSQSCWSAASCCAVLNMAL